MTSNLPAYCAGPIIAVETGPFCAQLQHTIDNGSKSIEDWPWTLLFWCQWATVRHSISLKIIYEMIWSNYMNGIFIYVSATIFQTIELSGPSDGLSNHWNGTFCIPTYMTKPFLRKCIEIKSNLFTAPHCHASNCLSNKTVPAAIHA